MHHRHTRRPSGMQYRANCFPYIMTSVRLLLQIHSWSRHRLFPDRTTVLVAVNIANGSVDRCWKVIPILGQDVFENHGDNENSCSEEEDVRCEGHGYALRRHLDRLWCVPLFVLAYLNDLSEGIYRVGLEGRILYSGLLSD